MRKRMRAGTARTRARHKVRVRLHAPLHVLAREAEEPRDGLVAQAWVSADAHDA